MCAIAAGSLSPASDWLQDLSRFRRPVRKHRALATPRAQGPQERLDSWKEIAAYVKRTVRTAQRWEEREGLPVRRLVHNRLASVYAFKCELDAWWESRCVVPTNESGHLSGRNSEFSHVGRGRKTLTLLIRIEIAEGAGHAYSNDSELARLEHVPPALVTITVPFETNGISTEVRNIGSAKCCDKPSMSHLVACDVRAGSLGFTRGSGLSAKY
jgi:hypothetical protein